MIQQPKQSNFDLWCQKYRIPQAAYCEGEPTAEDLEEYKTFISRLYLDAWLNGWQECELTKHPESIAVEALSMALCFALSALRTADQPGHDKLREKLRTMGIRVSEQTPSQN